MRLNENSIISGNSVLLVPYERFHVPKYHEWMKSKELQVLTASEPLSLEDEYKMQISWRTDHDKCTFIILDKINYDECNDEVKSMVGDTNIFLKNENGMVLGEIEIMIAEKCARGKGLGKEALHLMLRYGIENLNIKLYEAKIVMNNEISISLFTKTGFEKVNENQIFKEYTFSRSVTEAWTEWLKFQTTSYCIGSKT